MIQSHARVTGLGLKGFLGSDSPGVPAVNTSRQEHPALLEHDEASVYWKLHRLLRTAGKAGHPPASGADETRRSVAFGQFLTGTRN